MAQVAERSSMSKVLQAQLLGNEAPPAAFAEALEAELGALLTFDDELTFDPSWSAAQGVLKTYALRPAKRVRPTLLVIGHALATNSRQPPKEVRRFAAALELLHAFMLVHDDVADRALTRRGGPSLQLLLGAGRDGEDLAVVMGDHLYARAVEAMLSSGLPAAPAVTRYMMEVCRHTAVGQYLDLTLTRAPLADVTLFQALKVAHLKTAKYGFVAPLVAGAMLGGAEAPLLEQLERAGRHAGMAFQLRDDLIGLFGDDSLAGKAGGGDFVEGKRTFPVVAAWTKADTTGRAELERLWSLPREQRDGAALEQARALVRRFGGEAATERVVARLTRWAQRGLAELPDGAGARAALDALLVKLARRAA